MHFRLSFHSLWPSAWLPLVPPRDLHLPLPKHWATEPLPSNPFQLMSSLESAALTCFMFFCISPHPPLLFTEEPEASEGNCRINPYNGIFGERVTAEFRKFSLAPLVPQTKTFKNGVIIYDFTSTHHQVLSTSNLVFQNWFGLGRLTKLLGDWYIKSKGPFSDILKNRLVICISCKRTKRLV